MFASHFFDKYLILILYGFRLCRTLLTVHQSTFPVGRWLPDIFVPVFIQVLIHQNVITFPGFGKLARIHGNAGVTTYFQRRQR